MFDSQFLLAASAKPLHPSHGVQDWRQRHDGALQTPLMGIEEPLVDMLRGWHAYARAHIARYGVKLGDDYVLGPAWFQIGSAMLRMLNGELGRLDGGTLDKFIRQTLLDNGFDQKMVDDA